MAKYTGQVFKVYPKEFSGKMNYSFKLEDNPIFFRLGTTRHEGVVEPGSVVEVEADLNSDGKSAKVTSVKKASAQAQAQVAGAAGTKDSAIQYQSSRKDAIEFVILLNTTGTLASLLPKKEAAKVGFLEALVDKYTAQFYEDIGALGAVSRANGDSEPAKGKAEAEDEDEE